MKVAVLTSSRADYGIYLPLLKRLKSDAFFDLHIIAFGTHLSKAHGETINQIISDGFDVSIKVDTMPQGDTALDISNAMGKTVTTFSEAWSKNQFDLVFCLGDRYEMFAACAASVPFNVTLAHIHGGEQTLGAIDEAFRHSITHISQWHFTTTEQYRERVVQLKNNEKHVYNVGALSIDNLKNLQLLSIDEFKNKFNIDLSIPSVLITFHPETVSLEKNETYTNELIAALKQMNNYQLIITMPNADTMGNMIRERLNQFISETPNAIGVENFGALGYLSCMKHCSFMLGNTSSGFVEAAFFPKYVINLGDRQKGRIVTPNIRNTAITQQEILAAVNDFSKTNFSSYQNIYGNGNAASQIVKLLKDEFGETN